jgi:hypothetical protein
MKYSDKVVSKWKSRPNSQMDPTTKYAVKFQHTFRANFLMQVDLKLCSRGGGVKIRRIMYLMDQIT